MLFLELSQEVSNVLKIREQQMESCLESTGFEQQVLNYGDIVLPTLFWRINLLLIVKGSQTSSSGVWRLYELFNDDDLFRFKNQYEEAYISSLEKAIIISNGAHFQQLKDKENSSSWHLINVVDLHQMTYQWD